MGWTWERRASTQPHPTPTAGPVWPEPLVLQEQQSLGRPLGCGRPGSQAPAGLSGLRGLDTALCWRVLAGVWICPRLLLRAQASLRPRAPSEEPSRAPTSLHPGPQCRPVPSRYPATHLRPGTLRLSLWSLPAGPLRLPLESSKTLRVLPPPCPRGGQLQGRCWPLGPPPAHPGSPGTKPVRDMPAAEFIRDRWTPH